MLSPGCWLSSRYSSDSSSARGCTCGTCRGWRGLGPRSNGAQGHLVGLQYRRGEFGGHWGQRLKSRGTWWEENSAALGQYRGCRARTLLGHQGPGGHWRADPGVHSRDQEGTGTVAGVPVATRTLSAGPGVQGSLGGSAAIGVYGGSGRVPGQFPGCAESGASGAAGSGGAGLGAGRDPGGGTGGGAAGGGFPGL